MGYMRYVIWRHGTRPVSSTWKLFIKSQTKLHDRSTKNTLCFSPVYVSACFALNRRRLLPALFLCVKHLVKKDRTRLVKCPKHTLCFSGRSVFTYTFGAWWFWCLVKKTLSLVLPGISWLRSVMGKSEIRMCTTVWLHFLFLFSKSLGIARLTSILHFYHSTIDIVSGVPDHTSFSTCPILHFAWSRITTNFYFGFKNILKKKFWLKLFSFNFLTAQKLRHWSTHFETTNQKLSSQNFVADFWVWRK